MKTRILALVLGAAFGAQIAAAQSAILGKNLLPEGSFEIYGESRLIPLGWNFPDRNDKPWFAGFKAEAVAGESGGKEVRIVRPEPASSTMVGTKLTLPPKIDRLRVNYRILPKAITLGEADPAGNGAGVFARFYDSAGAAIRGSGGWVGGQAKEADTEWQDREAVFNVPASATILELQIIFRSAAGDVRVDDIEVVPVTMTE